MPAVPKPSQKRLIKQKRDKHGHFLKKTEAPAKRVKRAGKPANRKSHPIPQHGKAADWLAEIKAKGGITRQGVKDGCVSHGLKATMHNGIAAWCRQLGLLVKGKD